jgi:ComF family protein
VSTLRHLAVLGHALLDFVYPPSCLACGAELEQASALLCDRCWEEITRARPVRCGRCSCPLPAPASECANCASWEPGLERVLVLAPFERAVQEAIHALKFRQQPALGAALGRRIGQAVELQADLRRIGLLVPVPLHPSRQRERGYNQSLHIARGLAGPLGVPVCPGILRRRLATRPQASLSAAERHANLRGAFAVAGPLPPHACIGVVDDVVTTSATLAACSAALRAAGADRVWGVAVACPFLTPGPGVE